MRTNNTVKVEQADKLAGLEEESAQVADQTRKPFVEPEISAPVDVLQATTFFQGTTSGAVT